MRRRKDAGHPVEIGRSSTPSFRRRFSSRDGGGSTLSCAAPAEADSATREFVRESDRDRIRPFFPFLDVPSPVERAGPTRREILHDTRRPNMARILDGVSRDETRLAGSSLVVAPQREHHGRTHRPVVFVRLDTVAEARGVDRGLPELGSIDVVPGEFARYDLGDNPFDLVVCVNSLLYVPLATGRAAILHWQQQTRAGGLHLITTYTIDDGYHGLPAVSEDTFVTSGRLDHDELQGLYPAAAWEHLGSSPRVISSTSDNRGRRRARSVIIARKRAMPDAD
jgi:hypothetical protein